MKLLTKAMQVQLARYPLYSQDGKGDNAKILFKFFTPNMGWTWYVLEGEPQENGDYHFFGIVSNNGEREYGYFSLNELQNIRLPFGLSIERDLHFTSCTVSKLNSRAHL